MRPILFNAEIVRAILEGRKTATRRPIKLIYNNTHLEMRTDKYGTRLIEIQNKEPGVTTVRNPDGTTTHKLLAAFERTPPYRPGDILYVRETWTESANGYEYRADYPDSDGWGWRPSIHMPKKAARIFLKITDVKVQRVQDITDEECMEEGIQAWTKDGKLYKYYPADYEGDHPACDWQDCPKDPKEAMRRIWNDCYSKPRPVKVKGVIDHYESYPWEDIQETRTYRGKPWYVIGNPWVWVIEFERCKREEGE